VTVGMNHLDCTISCKAAPDAALWRMRKTKSARLFVAFEAEKP